MTEERKVDPLRDFKDFFSTALIKLKRGSKSYGDGKGVNDLSAEECDAIIQGIKSFVVKELEDRG